MPKKNYFGFLKKKLSEKIFEESIEPFMTWEGSSLNQ